MNYVLPEFSVVSALIPVEFRPLYFELNIISFYGGGSSPNQISEWYSFVWQTAVY